YSSNGMLLDHKTVVAHVGGCTMPAPENRKAATSTPQSSGLAASTPVGSRSATSPPTRTSEEPAGGCTATIEPAGRVSGRKWSKTVRSDAAAAYWSGDSIVRSTLGSARSADARVEAAFATS